MQLQTRARISGSIPARMFLIVVIALVTGCRSTAAPDTATPMVPTATTAAPAATALTATAATAATAGASQPATAGSPIAPTAAVTALPVGSATATVSGGGILFGPFHLPDAQFGPPYTGAFASLTPETAVATLDAARAAHIRLIIQLAGSRRAYQNSDRSFSVDRFNQAVDAFKSIDFAPYVADGTLTGHMMFDEPFHASNWNGQPVPFADIEAVAAHGKQLWPTLPTGVGAPDSFLQGGAPWTSLDFGYAQYTTQRGDVKTWLTQEVGAARQSHLGLVVGINILGGNNRSNVSADQLKEWGQVLVSEPSICGVLMWKYDTGYLGDPNIASALQALAQIARTHESKACRP
jgi:hypothetical protein